MGRTPYSTVLRLYAIADLRWAEIDGAYAQADIIRYPVHRFLNCIYAWCVDRIDPETREEWDMMLSAPLPGREAKPSPAELEADGASFMALMATQNADD